MGVFNAQPDFIDCRGLSQEEVQQAINEYIANRDELIKENKRLNRLIDELLNEIKYLKNINK